MMSSERTSVLLVDDHPMVRDGLVRLLETFGFTAAVQAGSCREALAHEGLNTCRLAVVDLSLGDEDGTEFVKHLRGQGIPVVVYSMHEGSNVIRRALDAGAGAYVTKREVSGSLLEAVEAVMAGARYLSPRAEAALSNVAPEDALSGQQQRIYRLLGSGLSNDAVARELGISVRTLESYCVRIMDKLGVQGVKALRQQAIRNAGTNPSDAL